MDIQSISMDPRMTRRMALGALGAAAILAGTTSASAASARDHLLATPAPDTALSGLPVLFGIEAEFTEIVPVGFTPRGLRFDLAFAGAVTGGPFDGAEVRGTDALLIRPDGVGVMDARAIITTATDSILSGRAVGYGIMPAGLQLPPPEVILDPGFVWPEEVRVTLHGFALHETGAEDLAWLNRTALALVGTASLGTRMLSETFHAIGAVPELE